MGPNHALDSFMAPQDLALVGTTDSPHFRGTHGVRWVRVGLCQYFSMAAPAYTGVFGWLWNVTPVLPASSSYARVFQQPSGHGHGLRKFPVRDSISFLFRWGVIARHVLPS